MLCRQQLRNLTENKESELQCLFDQIERQEQLLEEIHREKRGVFAALALIFLCLRSWYLRLEKKLLLLPPVQIISIFSFPLSLLSSRPVPRGKTILP